MLEGFGPPSSRQSRGDARARHVAPSGRVEPLERRVLLSVFTVSSTADAGPGSLRQAILDANAHTNDQAGPDEIHFAIDRGAKPVATIAPASALPVVTDAVVIDGTTEPGYANKPIVELSGQGIEISAGHSTVKGLVLNGAGLPSGFA